MAVWWWQAFFFPVFFLSHLNFHVNPLKIQEQPIHLVALQIWFFFYYDFFILNNLLNLIPTLFIVIFCLVSIDFVLRFHHLLLFFFLSDLIVFFLLPMF